jgi:hypothetical protein
LDLKREPLVWFLQAPLQAKHRLLMQEIPQGGLHILTSHPSPTPDHNGIHRHMGMVVVVVIVSPLLNLRDSSGLASLSKGLTQQEFRGQSPAAHRQHRGPWSHLGCQVSHHRFKSLRWDGIGSAHGHQICHFQLLLKELL